MTFTAVVIYPNQPDATFDTDYYLQTHMPLVAKHWGPHGLKSWNVVKYERDLAGASPKYLIAATLVWESEEAVKAATSSESAPIIFGDIPNFTNTQPITLAGSTIGGQEIS
ncbi:ethyl tert-butyl ether degradation EthD [Penicillium brasilianum]|uniref:Ethyl tert-butyl ether degradation EthD n=1 Tax=Penicillium brasilianum TaxID=104259 RepID=A0A0F7TPG0_PENBI|nr:ethyl tert-butyl ether degradation EthD [Penicillium brasilianum]CEJ58643.1 hypothetical protein PMG11_07293 [Penicillium brasilianum]